MRLTPSQSISSKIAAPVLIILALVLLFAAYSNSSSVAAQTSPPQSDTPTPYPTPTLTPLNLDEVEIEQPHQSNDILVPESYSQATTNQSSSSPRAEKVLAALIDFADVAPSQRYFSRSDVANLLNDNPDSLKNFILATSRNKVDVKFDVLDWITLDKKRAGYSLYDGRVIEDAVSAMSYHADLSQYDKVVLFIFPIEQGYPGCQAYLGSLTWHTPNGSFELGAAWLSGYNMSCVKKGRIAHEFGHTFGFLHSLQVSPCDKEPPVPGSLLDPTDMNDSCYDESICANDDCTDLETGDADIFLNQDFDMMGGDHDDRYEEFFPVHFHAAWQAQAGWLTPSQVLVSRTPGEYRLTLLESLTPDPKAIKIPIGNDHRGNPQYYWLESREYDQQCSVNIRLQTSAILGDELNHTYNFGWIVSPGIRFEDPHRGIQVEMLECTGAGTTTEEIKLNVNFSQLDVDTPLAAAFVDGETTSTLTNKSEAPIAIGPASIGGRHSDSFIIYSDECSNTTLDPGASCRVTVWHVSPNPQTDLSEKHGVLKIPNNDSFAPEMTVGLLGNQPRALPEETPTPEPTPATNTCVQPLPNNGTANGNWTSGCSSENKAGSYAQYYTFTLNEESDATITLDSSEDTYLYLLRGVGDDGPVVYENDDYATLINTEACAGASGLGEYDSCITASLIAGDYTIEATTYDAGVTGDFTLIVEAQGSGMPPEPLPPSVGYTSLVIGELHTCGLRTDGSVVCWGNDDYNQVSDTPTGTFTFIAASLDHTCGLRTDATVACWGNDDHGQVSDIPANDRFDSIFVGTYHNCGIRTDGAAICWGRNDDHQSTPP